MHHYLYSKMRVAYITWTTYQEHCTHVRLVEDVAVLKLDLRGYIVTV